MSDTFDNFPFGYESARSMGCYRAWCTRVVDGDTYDFICDLGITVRIKIRVRLKDFDTPEIFHPANDAERAAGMAAKTFVETLILDRPCLIRTYRTATGSDLATVGRYVADVFHVRPDSAAVMWADLRIDLRDNGFAKGI